MPSRKILLINPPFSYEEPRIKTFSVPLGLLYLAASVGRRHAVKVVDLNFECDLNKVIGSFDPGFIGLSSFSPQLPLVVELADGIKKKFPGKKIILGGVHATIDGARILKRHPSFDYALRGEGEHSLLKLLDGKKLSKIPGLIFREDGAVIDSDPTIIEHLDCLPFPARHLINIDHYQDLPFHYLHHKHTSLMTSRGCPHNCIYCYDTAAKRYREHSPPYVIKEIKHLKRAGFNDFIFTDDIFTMNPGRVEEICGRITDQELDITWSCETRPDKVSPKLLRLMKEAGCHFIFYGIESGNQEVLNRIRKGFSLATVRRAVKDAKEVGLRVHAGFILGFPFESEAQLDDSVEFSKSIGLDGAEYTIATPHPGTALWKLAGHTDPSDLGVLKELNYTQVTGNPFWDSHTLAGKYSQAIMGFYFRKQAFSNVLHNVLTKGTLQRRWELFKYLTFKGPADKGGPSHDELPTTPTLIEKFFKEQCQLCHGCDHTCKKRWLCYIQKIVNGQIYSAYSKGLRLIERGRIPREKRNENREQDRQGQ